MKAGTPCNTWSGGAAPDADTNGDGVSNALAWALGAANPSANAVTRLPTLDNTSDAVRLIFEFNRSDAAHDDSNTTITVRYGSDLAGWTTAVEDNDKMDMIVTPGSPKDTVKVKLKRSTLGAGGEFFARLRVVATP